MSKLDNLRWRGQKGGRRAAVTNQYPLRRFKGYIDNPDLLPKYHMPVELLECGHWMYTRRDIFGDNHATRRRCKKCFDQKPIEIDVALYE